MLKDASFCNEIMSESVLDRINRVDEIVVNCRRTAFEGLLIKALRHSSVEASKTALKRIWEDYADVEKASAMPNLVQHAYSLMLSLKPAEIESMAVSVGPSYENRLRPSCGDGFMDWT